VYIQIYIYIYIYLLVNPQRQHNAKVSWGYRIKPSTKTMATMKQIIPRVGIQVSYCRNEVVCFLQMFVMRKKIQRVVFAANGPNHADDQPAMSTLFALYACVRRPLYVAISTRLIINSVTNNHNNNNNNSILSSMGCRCRLLDLRILCSFSTSGAPRKFKICDTYPLLL